jgi:hypothetical protein
MEEGTKRDLRFLLKLDLNYKFYHVPYSKQERDLALSAREEDGSPTKDTAELPVKGKKEIRPTEKTARYGVSGILVNYALSLLLFFTFLFVMHLSFPEVISVDYFQNSMIFMPNIYGFAILFFGFYLLTLVTYSSFSGADFFMFHFSDLLMLSPISRRTIVLYGEIRTYLAAATMSFVGSISLTLLIFPALGNPLLAFGIFFSAFFIISVIVIKGISLLSSSLSFARTRRVYLLLKRSFNVIVVLIAIPLLKLAFDFILFEDLNSTLNLYLQNPLTLLLLLPLNTFIVMVSEDYGFIERVVIWLSGVSIAVILGYLRYMQLRILLSKSWKERYSYHGDSEEKDEKVKKDELRYLQDWDEYEVSGSEVFQRLPWKILSHRFSKNPTKDIIITLTIPFFILLTVIVVSDLPLVFLMYLLLAIPILFQSLADHQEHLLIFEDDLNWVRLIPEKPETLTASFQRTMDLRTFVAGFFAGIILAFPIAFYFILLFDTYALLIITVTLVFGINSSFGYNIMKNLYLSGSMKQSVSPIHVFAPLDKYLPMFSDVNTKGVLFGLKKSMASVLEMTTILLLLSVVMVIPFMWAMVPALFNPWVVASNTIVIICFFFLARFTFQNNMIKLLTHNHRNRDRKVRRAIIAVICAVIIEAVIILLSTPIVNVIMS